MRILFFGISLVFIFTLSIPVQSQSLCYCSFENTKLAEDFKEAQIYSLAEETYGYIAELQYRVLNQENSENSYHIEVQIADQKHLYQVHQQRLSFHGIELGYAPKIEIGIQKIISHIFSNCPQVAKAQKTQLQVLFNTKT